MPCSQGTKGQLIVTFQRNQPHLLTITHWTLRETNGRALNHPFKWQSEKYLFNLFSLISMFSWMRKTKIKKWSALDDLPNLLPSFMFLRPCRVRFYSTRREHRISYIKLIHVRSVIFYPAPSLKKSIAFSMTLEPKSTNLWMLAHLVSCP